ncbi:hypothetical protein LCI18_012822 [Fusarium solani-melongenae]|uniref:Uncharacterized protein n=1 Tax=Fusarium solani subsp. cucurbitae TaxID=2747967 RepID=A0ACD3ZLB9_FUSSC|nr:hypothetical protein LCI18_012822 [Fusarium solani-melongenae]
MVQVQSTANLTGEEISDIAYAQSSIPSSGLGLATEVLIYILTVVCAVVIALRVYVKTWSSEASQGWRVNDYLAVIGFLPFIPASVLGALAVHYGIGSTDAYLNRFEMRKFLEVRGMEYLILYELTYYASSSLTKFAIAVTILHICVEKRYVYIMYGLMGVMIATNGICLIWLFVNCVPFATYWNPNYIGTAVQVASDWTCAITPFFIVYSLQMPKRVKISVVAILGLGVVASVAALMRIVSYKYIDVRVYPKDHFLSQGRLLFWSLLESAFAIIACSLPSLKLFGGCIARSMNRSTNNTPLHSLTPKGQTRTTVSGKGNWDRLHDDDSSGRHIIQETTIHVDSRSTASTPNYHRSESSVV